MQRFDRGARASQSDGVQDATAEAPGRAAPSEPDAALVGMETAAAGGGIPVPDQTRGKIEDATGVNLSGVTVNAGAEGAALAEEHDARAVAVGQQIHVGAGERLDGPDGEHLLAHEVAHTMQHATAPKRARAQRRSRSRRQRRTLPPRWKPTDLRTRSRAGSALRRSWNLSGPSRHEPLAVTTRRRRRRPTRMWTPPSMRRLRRSWRHPMC